MKVLHVLSAMDPRYGGPTSALLGLAEAQRLAGLEVGITATHYWQLPEWQQLERVKALGVEVNLFHYRPRAEGTLTPFITKLKEDISLANVVHIHALWHSEQFRAATICLQLKKPYLFRACGMLAPWSMQQSYWKKRLYWYLRLRRRVLAASAIHYTTNREARCSQSFVSSVPSIVEPNGICLENLPTEEVVGGEQLQPGKMDRPTVLFLGRLHPKKGIPLLLESAKSIPEAEFVIAGPDNDGYQNELKKIVGTLSIGDRVRFVGELVGSERSRAYRSATVFVLPSKHENFGNSVIEALASGTPVVISDQVDLCEDLTGVPFCKVVPLNEPSLTKALRDSIREYSVQKPTIACRTLVKDRFEWKQIGERWCKHYADLVAN